MNMCQAAPVRCMLAEERLGGSGGDSREPQGDSRAPCPLWGQDRVVHPGRHEGWVAPGAC